MQNKLEKNIKKIIELNNIDFEFKTEDIPDVNGFSTVEFLNLYSLDENTDEIIMDREDEIYDYLLENNQIVSIMVYFFEDVRRLHPEKLIKISTIFTQENSCNIANVFEYNFILNDADITVPKECVEFAA